MCVRGKCICICGVKCVCMCVDENVSVSVWGKVYVHKCGGKSVVFKSVWICETK